MPNLIQIIKQAALEAVEASNPTKVFYGIVVNDSLSIKIDQKFTITRDFILLPNRIKEEGLNVGDKVILLQEQGGQNYIILDKMGV